MKKLIIITGFLCFSLFAFAGEKSSLIGLSFGIALSPGDSYSYSDVNGAIIYGHRITSQSFGVIGIDLSTKLNGGLLFGYEHEFVSGGNWLPGANASLLVGVAEKGTTLGLGADIGLFLKLGPSTSKWQGIAQTGLRYFSAVSELGKSIGERLQHYISVGLRLNF